MRVKLLVPVRYAPWRPSKILRRGRLGTVEECSNLPNKIADCWFTPDNMNKEEESYDRNYGFLVNKDQVEVMSE